MISPWNLSLVSDPSRPSSRLELSHGVLLEFPAVWVVKLVVGRCAHCLAATLPIRNSHQLQVFMAVASGLT